MRLHPQSSSTPAAVACLIFLVTVVRGSESPPAVAGQVRFTNDLLDEDFADDTVDPRWVREFSLRNKTVQEKSATSKSDT